MAQQSSQHTCFQGRQPWIEKDLLKLKPEIQSQKFEGNLLVARFVISETDEHFLEDGLHIIPVIFDPSSNNDLFHGSHNHQLNKFENGMVIGVFEYSYVIRVKDGALQFFINVNSWDHVTIDLPGISNHLADINSLETTKSFLQRCLVNIVREKDSASQLLLSQLISDSQNLLDLARIANEALSCSQSQQNCQPLDTSYHHHLRPEHLSEILSNNDISTPVSSDYMEICDVNTSVAPMTLTSYEVLPGHGYISSHDSLDKIKNVWQPNQEHQRNQKSNMATQSQQSCVKEPYASEVQQNDKSFIDSVAEQSISPTQLLEMMLQETQQNYGLQKSGQEKVICPGSFEENDPSDILKSAAFPNGRMAAPTFQDLFVPSDQRRSLALIQGWYLSDSSSRDSSSSSSQAFFSPSSRNNYSSFGNLYLQPTMKDYKRHNYTVPKIISDSDHLSPGLMKENCLDSSEKVINDKLFSHHLSQELVKENYCGNSATNISEKCVSVHLSQELIKEKYLVNEKNVWGKLVLDNSSNGLIQDNCLVSENNISGKLGPGCGGQSSVENERSKNSSESLFSDTDHENSSLADNLEPSIQPKESTTLLQQKHSSFPCCPESNESTISKQSCARAVNACGSLASNPLQFGESNISLMGAVDCLVAEALIMKPHPEPTNIQENKCAASEIIEISSQITESGQRNVRDTDQTSSSDFTLDTHSDSSSAFYETKAKQQNANECPDVAVMSSVIDLSSTDDIYMIAGHDIDSYCENLVSSTDSEMKSPFQPCEVSTQIESHAPETPMVAYFESLSADEETDDNVAICDNNINNQSFTSFAPFKKSCNSTPSPEMTSSDNSETLSQTSCTESQDVFSLNSVNWHSRNEQTRDSAKCDLPLNAQLGCVPLNIPQKSTANGVLKSALQNIATAINSGMHVKTQVAPPTQEPKLEKLPVPLKILEKAQEYHLSLEESKSKNEFNSDSCIITSNRDYPFPSTARRSQCAHEPLTKELRVLVTDIMKRKRRLLSNGQTNLSPLLNDGPDHHTCAKKRKVQLTTSSQDGKVEGNQNRTRSHKKRSRYQLRKSGQSMVQLPKKRFSINVTEVGECDQNILEIEQLFEESPKSEQHSDHPSDLGGDSDSREQFTEIKEKYTVNIQTMGQQISSSSEKCNGMQACRTSESETLREGRRQSRSMVTNKASGEYGGENEVLTSTSSASLSNHKTRVAPPASSLFSQTACYSASDWSNVMPVLTRSPELETEEDQGTLFPQNKSPPKLFLPPATFDSQGFVPSASRVSSLFSQNASYSSSDWSTNSSEFEESQATLFGQNKSPPKSDVCSTTFDSQGFVPSTRDDDRRYHSSVRLEAQSTEATVADSGNSESLRASAKLYQSIASVVNYICRGKLL